MSEKPISFEEKFRLLKASEIAHMLNVSKAFVYKLMREGELPVVKILGTKRVRKIDLEKLISKNLIG